LWYIHFSQHGYDDDLETFGLMTAIFSASYTLGSIIGPFVSGVLYDSLGFRASTYFVLASTTFAVSTFGQLFLQIKIHKSLSRNNLKLKLAIDRLANSLC